MENSRRDHIILCLDTVWESMSKLCEPLTEEQWKLATDCPGWSVQDQMSHIAALESKLAGGPALDHTPPESSNVKNPQGATNEADVDYRRSWSGSEVLQEFNEGLVSKLAPVFSITADAPLQAAVGAIAEVFLDHWQAEAAFVRCYAGRSAGGVDLGDLYAGVNPPMVRALGVALQAAAAHRGRQLVHGDLAIQALLALWLRVGLQHLFNDSVARDDARDTLVTLTVGAVSALLEQAPVLPESDHA